MTVLCLETSAVLRAALEPDSNVSVIELINAATSLVTSRLSLVEAARAIHRLRREGVVEETLATAEANCAAIWARCDVWELSPALCQMAANIVPTQLLRTLDALHLATFQLARRRLPGLRLLSLDTRLRDAAGQEALAL